MSKNIHPISKDTPTTPTSRQLSPFAEMEHMFENFFPQNWMHPFSREIPLQSRLAATFTDKWPKVDIIDRDNEIVVRAELPGIDKKDVEVSLANNTVTIQGSSKHEVKEEKGSYYRCETSQGSYLRTLSLPADVNTDKAKASFKDGLLELVLPKVQVAQKHNIKIE